MKLHVPFVQLPLHFDAARLRAEVGQIPESSWRPHPQGYPGNDALTLVTTGGDPESDHLGGAMLPTPHLLACPYLMQVLHSIGATWGRTRLMRLSGHAEVSPHVDVNYYWREHHRVHVPITTQPTVRFICGGDEINMAEGECWIFDTWRLHHVINDATQARIHLVADTVGGEQFWEHVLAGRAAKQNIPGWQAPLLAPVPELRPQLDYESRNVPVVMTPWELKEHIVFLLGEAVPHPELAIAHRALLRFARNWQALWACYGEDAAGWPRYRRLLDQVQAELAAQCRGIALQNGFQFIIALFVGILDVALADRKSGDSSAPVADADNRQAPQAARA
jgi:hypothetical protein